MKQLIRTGQGKKFFAAVLMLLLLGLATAVDVERSTSGGSSGSGIISIKEVEDSLSRPLDQAVFPPLELDSWRPPRPAYKPSHLTPEEEAELREDDEGDDVGDDDSSSSSDGDENFLPECLAAEKERLTSLLGTSEAAKSNKIRRQVKAVAKRSCDAQVAERQYWSYLTDPLSIVPSTPAGGNDDESNEESAEIGANETSASAAAVAAESTESVSSTTSNSFLSRINPIQTEFLAPALIDWPKQVKMVDRLKESAKDSRLLRNEIQHEKIAASAEEAPLLGQLVNDLESQTLSKCTSVLRQLDEHKKYQLALMMTLPSALAEAEKNIVSSADASKDLKKLKALGKYASTRSKRSTGADLAEQYEMLYVHHSVKGKVQPFVGEEQEAVEIIPENSLSEIQILPSSFWSLILTDVSSLQGVAVWVFITTTALVALPWAIWLGSFVLVLGIGMWQKNPAAGGGGRRLGSSKTEGGGRGGMSLVSIPYRAWQFTTFFGFRLGMIAILFYLILMVDRKYFFPFKAGLPLTLLVFNVKYFFTQSTICLLYGVVLGLSFSLSGAVLSLTSSSSSRSGSKKKVSATSSGKKADDNREE